MPFAFRSSRGLHVNRTRVTADDLRLAASANGRYLVKADGTPFLLTGQAAWAMPAQLSQSNTTLFLDDQQSRGYNTVLYRMLSSYWATNSPNNVDNVAPFNTKLGGGALDFDLSDPKETYWAYIDWQLAQCAARGIVVLAAPMYLGNNTGVDGFYQTLTVNSTAKCQAYGTFLGNRYRNTPNIIWVMAGDKSWASMSAQAQSDLTAMTNALKAADPNHLVTAHINGSQCWEIAGPWQDCFLTYPPGSPALKLTHSTALDGYAHSPHAPVFLGESLWRDGDWDGDVGGPSRAQVRSEIWQMMTSGASGGTFGDENVGIFDAPNGFGEHPPWQNELGSAFSGDWIRCLRTFFAPRAWWKLVPDTGNTLVTAGRNTLGTASYVTAALASDGTWAAIWIPAGGAITANCNQLASPVTARWFDPSNGALSSAGSGLTGSQVFTPPGTNAAGDSDWALELVAA